MSAYLPAKKTAISEIGDLLRRSFKSLSLLVCVAALAWTVSILVPARLGANATLLSLKPYSSDRPEVLLKSARAERKYEFVSVTGSLANVSRRNLQDVEA